MNASKYFKVARLRSSGEVIAYCCGTCTKKSRLDHESMFQHSEDGSTTAFLVPLVSGSLNLRQLCCVFTRLRRAQAIEEKALLLRCSNSTSGPCLLNVPRSRASGCSQKLRMADYIASAVSQWLVHLPCNTVRTFGTRWFSTDHLRSDALKLDWRQSH